MRRKLRPDKPAFQKRIMVFGTFDMVHEGHVNFFKQARALASNPFLIVSVARDVNVARIKGKTPLVPERLRRKNLALVPLVDKAVLGGKHKYFFHIKRQRPDVIALGYDQKAYVKELLRDIKTAGMKTKVIRLRAYKAQVYKSSLIKKNMLK
ncbi:MAG: adenylyltransferase/cytidyltransferase family protein [Patescibacteria group bacterium]|nr:adenylyltransferase/cytidyltransferase family protein [Patescibacteria group bacterium]